MKEYTEREIVELVEQRYGPNQGSGLFGRQAWHIEHEAKLRKEMKFRRKKSPPSQAKPSSFSEFWKKTN